MFSMKSFSITLKELGEYSNILTKALGNYHMSSSIRTIQRQDTPEPWGIGTHYDSAYGRHLQYESKTNGLVPFWIGLAAKQNDITIALILDRRLLAAINAIQSIKKLNKGTHTIIPPHCNLDAHQTNEVEVDLFDTDFQKFKSTPSSQSQILADFIDEVLSVL